MNIAQFVILTIFYIMSVYCTMHSMSIQIDQKRLTKMEMLLQIIAIVSMTIVYGLGVVGCFLGIYKI